MKCKICKVKCNESVTFLNEMDGRVRSFNFLLGCSCIELSLWPSAHTHLSPPSSSVPYFTARPKLRPRGYRDNVQLAGPTTIRYTVIRALGLEESLRG